jgi:hypothetical protein
MAWIKKLAWLILAAPLLLSSPCPDLEYFHRFSNQRKMSLSFSKFQKKYRDS